MTALLSVEDLVTEFRTAAGPEPDAERVTVRAVDGVSFTVERGKTTGVVG